MGSTLHTYAKENVMWVYFSQLTFATGKSSECQPAYQAAATISTVALVDPETEIVASAEIVVARTAEIAKKESGRKAHMVTFVQALKKGK